MTRYKATISYDGTLFAGFQRQPHARSVQEEIEYKPTDILLFGPEPGDIPDPMDIMAGPHVAEQVRLPMRPSLRSLNLTNCASIAIYEAWRQLNFIGGK